MATPILYYWAPCATCAIVTDFATEHGIELDKRDVEQEAPYNELLALGGDANLIPYLWIISLSSRGRASTFRLRRLAISPACLLTTRFSITRRNCCCVGGRSARSR